MRFQGRITNWNDDKGFGFVEPNGGGNRSFVHIKSFNKHSKRPVNGDLIVYAQVKEKNGKYKAVNIDFVNNHKKHKHRLQKSSSLGTIILFAFFVLLGITVLSKLIPVEVVYLYIAASIIAFVVYALDKSAAKNDRRRTPESQLHLLSVIGGWPGAFFAQNQLRHKSSKKQFKQVYWGTVVINICAFVWLLSEKGQQFLATIAG